MSKHAQDHLHRLIRSLSRAEKRYFKLYTSRHMVGGQSNYQLLFDVIAKMDEYDEAKLLNKFKKEAFTKRFAITKRRLYETVLKSLDAYHAESSVDARLHRMLHHVEILFKKALYPEASRMLNSVKRIADQHNRTTSLLDVGHWERRLLERTGYAKMSEGTVEGLSERMQKTLTELSNTDQLWTLKSNVFLSLYTKGQVRDIARAKEIKDLADHPLLTGSAADLVSVQEIYLYHHIHSAVAYSTGEMDNCYDHLVKEQELLESESVHFQEEPNLLFSVMSNRIFVGIRTGRYDDAFDQLELFRKLPEKLGEDMTEDMRIKLFATANSLELSIHAQMGEFKKGLDRVEEIEAGIARYNGALSQVRKADLYYIIAYLYFGAGELNQALKWSHKLLNDVRIDENEEIHCFGQLLNLLTHSEIGNTELLPYTLRSTERYFKTRKRNFRSEKVFLDMVRGVKKARSEKARAEALEQFKATMQELSNDPFERVIFDHFHAVAWAESKLGGRPFGEVVRQRAKHLKNGRETQVLQRSSLHRTKH